MKAVVTVMPKQDVLDPQGKAIQRAAGALGHAGVRAVRQGKRFEITLEADDRAGAESLLNELAEKLLSNPVIEEFHVESIEA